MDKGRYLGQFPPEFSRLHRDNDLYWTVPPRIRSLVVIMGPRFSGTSTAVKYMASHHRFRVVRCSRLVRDYAREHAYPADERAEYLQALGRLREDTNDDTRAVKLALREVRRRQLERGVEVPQDIVIDGVQSLPEFELLARHPRLRAIWLDPGFEKRLNFAVASGMMEIAADEYQQAEDMESRPSDEEVLRALDKNEDRGVAGPYDDSRRGGLKAIQAKYGLDLTLIEETKLGDVRAAIDMALNRPGGKLVSTISDERWLKLADSVDGQLERLVGSNPATEYRKQLAEIRASGETEAEQAMKISKLFADEHQLRNWAYNTHVELETNQMRRLVPLTGDEPHSPRPDGWTCNGNNGSCGHWSPELAVGAEPKPCDEHGTQYLVAPGDG